jgi:hypothetical protein
MTFYTPNNAEKETWLVQHVPHRICATLPWLPMPKEWIVPRPELPNMDFSVWCVDRSIEEGQKAAMRWLIEFIGVKLETENKVEKVVPVKPHKNGKSVSILQVGGRMFDTNRPEALKLAKVWQACSQASLHPTMDTKHDDVGPDDLASALQIVIAYLDSALYKPNGRDLWKIVHEQEKLAIARAARKQVANA